MVMFNWVIANILVLKRLLTACKHSPWANGGDLAALRVCLLFWPHHMRHNKCDYNSGENHVIPCLNNDSTAGSPLALLSLCWTLNLRLENILFFHCLMTLICIQPQYCRKTTCSSSSLTAFLLFSPPLQPIMSASMENALTTAPLSTLCAENQTR